MPVRWRTMSWLTCSPGACSPTERLLGRRQALPLQVPQPRSGLSPCPALHGSGQRRIRSKAPQLIRRSGLSGDNEVGRRPRGLTRDSQAHQGVDLLLQFLLSPEHPLVAHGFVLGGIGFHLGAIQRHMTQAHHPGLLAEAEVLNKQILEGIKVAAAKLTDAAVVRLLVGCQHPAGQILITGPLDLAGGDDAHAAGVEQQHRHRPGIKPFLATGIVGLCGPKDLRVIQFIHQIQQEVHLVIAASHSRGEGGSSEVWSGCQGRKDLGFCMPHFLDQIHWRHCDLGRFRSVCGDRGLDLSATGS